MKRSLKEAARMYGIAAISLSQLAETVQEHSNGNPEEERKLMQEALDLAEETEFYYNAYTTIGNTVRYFDPTCVGNLWGKVLRSDGRNVLVQTDKYQTWVDIKNITMVITQD